MLVEVVGVSTRNKGAELMLAAVRQHFLARPDVQLVVEPSFGTFRERSSYGLRAKLGPMKRGRAALSAAIMPKALREQLGLANESDIDAVLDASGFAFGDQLGPRRSERFARDVSRWKRQGKPVVLLPQALGPFETPRIRDAFLQVVNLADLIYARDETSMGYLNDLAPQHPRIRLAPDFTNLVEPEIPDEFEDEDVVPWACLVPNHRMVEKTTPEVRAAYIPFLANCLRVLEHAGIPCRILLHDVHVDQELVQPLEAAAGRKLSVIQESCPRRLKGILGKAHLVLGSRFHALVGALSQGVPTIAVGWSHKYEGLMSDYGCPECVLTPTSGDGAIREVLSPLINPAARQELVDRISTRGDGLKQQVRSMWQEVDSVLGLAASGTMSACVGSQVSL